jgi:hypothetical protein
VPRGVGLQRRAGLAQRSPGPAADVEAEAGGEHGGGQDVPAVVVAVHEVAVDLGGQRSTRRHHLGDGAGAGWAAAPATAVTATMSAAAGCVPRPWCTSARAMRPVIASSEASCAQRPTTPPGPW